METVTSKEILMKEELFQIVTNIVEASEGRIRLALNEEDTNTNHQPEAAHFLKLDEKRLGRDIELYEFMANVAGPQSALADFAEVVISLKSIPTCYSVAVDAMRALGRKVYPQDLIEQWDELFN